MKTPRKQRDLSLRVSYRCNQNCIFCAYGDVRKTNDKIATFEAIEDTLKKNKKKYDILELTTSSEPTIRKDFFKIVELACDLGYEIELVTNGRMFSYEEFCKRLKDYKIKLIVLCLHGPNAEIHDATTQANGSFNQVVQAIKNMKKYGFNMLGQIILTKVNYKHLLDTVKLMVELGMTDIRITFPDPYGNAEMNFDNVVPTYSEITPFVNKTLSWLKNKNDIHVDIKSFPYCCIDPKFRYLVAEGITTAVITLNDENVPFYITKIERVFNMAQQLDCCDGCKYHNRCEGVWKNYVAKYGSKEFKPVK